MKYIDDTLPTPQSNLACDEALLDWCEQAHRQEILRFWEPNEPFVVVGYANKIATEVNQEACRAHHIPVLRRCSGGGTVLQGPGSLNYSLILRIEESGPFESIGDTNRFILQRHRDALRALTGEQIEIQGSTDLAIEARKCSGNAQRRKRNHLLFHGTFLLQLDIALVESVLAMPSKQPDYRHNRSHTAFLTNLNASANAVKGALRKAWNAGEPLDELPRDQIAKLVQEKYGNDKWTFKF